MNNEETVYDKRPGIFALLSFIFSTGYLWYAGIVELYRSLSIPGTNFLHIIKKMFLLPYYKYQEITFYFNKFGVYFAEPDFVFFIAYILLVATIAYLARLKNKKGIFWIPGAVIFPALISIAFVLSFRIKSLPQSY